MLVREALPSLQRAAQAQSLADAFEHHLEETREHAGLVERVFELAAAETSSVPDWAAEKLVEEHDRIAGSIVEPRLADVFHAAAAARTEHHEIATYSALIALANALDLADAVPLLKQNRGDEAKALAEVEKIGARLAREAAGAR